MFLFLVFPFVFFHPAPTWFHWVYFGAMVLEGTWELVGWVRWDYRRRVGQ